MGFLFLFLSPVLNFTSTGISAQNNSEKRQYEITSSLEQESLSQKNEKININLICIKEGSEM